MNLETKQREQRNDALIIANKVRSRRARERVRLGTLPYLQGCEQLAGLIRECPDWIGGAWVHELLAWPRKMGAVRAKKLASALGLRGVRRLRDLSPRQREQLAGMLAGQVQNSGNEGGKAA